MTVFRASRSIRSNLEITTHTALLYNSSTGVTSTTVTLVQPSLMHKGAQYGSLPHHGDHDRTRLCHLRWKTSRVWSEPTEGPSEAITAEEGADWIWISFIHSGAHHELQISVDEHEVHVVAADGEFVYPQKVHAANCNLGERIGILVHLNKKPGDYAIRVASLRTEQIIQGLGILRYPSPPKGNAANVPTTKPWVHLNGSLISPTLTAMDETKLAPYLHRPPPAKSDNTVKFLANMTGSGAWALGVGSHQAFRQQLPPLLWDESSRANVTSQHPFHKHNNKAWIIGTGEGGFPWETVADAMEGGAVKNFNSDNPPIRDGCRLGNGTGDWTVIRYEIAFPAVSMLHCHMIHHFGTDRKQAGQQVVLLEGVESMNKVPSYVKDRVHAELVPPFRYGPLD
ncbi:uncharacterized protein NECHADRAFT_82322 [Fusarium vanettenii 77-13-4]|uniref:Plastocyanin-like domain-containing protein n=1 Tax=Fusarium vanettenii (strain ATCC MYA-4622 / CBS 123669 / FGSC 9596 / NRRL 45880 / 77-13-4) TaxID=660122 RepID=C7ZMZ7_FUSV7|nr:uncharacterized protein NECHADRAFT_82322 [Fusarium vanettenii 77-13-4]EEU34604.1 hypothetical protein NECHADRAFT_82322 [Fusarium vanettenii 77-13-4]